MRIVIAEQAGFCAGVERAVKLAENNAAVQKVRSLGPLIHNAQEVERLKKKGIIFTEEEIPKREEDSEGAVLIRSHGVGPSILAKLVNEGWTIIDATCPYVKSAQRIASQAASEGYRIIILGDKNHPEVKGLQEWAKGQAIVAASYKDVAGVEPGMKVALLAQTTEREERFDELAEFLQSTGADVIVHKTICNATQERQKSAQELAAQVDMMLVIGGRHSSNTAKLLEICTSVNKNSRLIEQASELDWAWFENIKSVGITAGASTPAWIIKEVVMSIEEHNGQEQTNLEQEQSLEQMEMEKTMEQAEAELKAEGDEKLDALERAQESGEIITAKVTEVVKGGLLVDVGVRGFVPASQVGRSFIEDLNQFLNQTLRLKVLEFDKAARKAVLSQRAVLDEEYRKQADEVWQGLKEGEVRKGRVARLTSFGAFVDIGGIDGLLHVSEMGWGHVAKPEEAVTEGQELDVIIKKIDKEKQKVSLSIKGLLDDPWISAAKKYTVGSTVTGKVVRTAPFGAFVELEPGIDGLIHISQLSNDRVAKVEDAVRTGQTVKAKVIANEPEKKRLSLSMKDDDGGMDKREYQAYLGGQESSGVTIGEILKQSGKKL